MNDWLGVAASWAISILMVLVLVLAYNYGEIKRELARSERNMRAMEDRYKSRSGSSSLFGSYSLRSVDGGQTWVALDKSGKMTGMADPALVAHLDGLEALSAYVELNGPIGSKGGITGEEAFLLRRVGFELRRKEEPNAP